MAGKTEGNRSLGRPGCRREDNVKEEIKRERLCFVKLAGSMHASFVTILYRGHTRVVKNACHLVSMGFSFCFFVCCSVGTKHNVHRGLGLFGNAVWRPWPSCRNAVLVPCCHMCIWYCTRLRSAKAPFSYSCNWHKELSALLFRQVFPSLRLPKTNCVHFFQGTVQCGLV